MATKSVSAQKKGEAQRAKFQNNSTWEQATFIQRDLTPAESQTCKDWDLNESHAFSSLANLCEAGYKVNFRWDDYGHCYACWLMPPKDHPENSGKILTGRGSTSYKSLKQALFKHNFIFEEVWPSEKDERGAPEIDD